MYSDRATQKAQSLLLTPLLFTRCEQWLHLPRFYTVCQLLCSIHKSPLQHVRSNLEDKNTDEVTPHSAPTQIFNCRSAFKWSQKSFNSPVTRTNHADFLGRCHRVFDLQLLPVRRQTAAAIESIYTGHTDARHTLCCWLVCSARSGTGSISEATGWSVVQKGMFQQTWVNESPDTGWKLVTAYYSFGKYFHWNSSWNQYIFFPR